MEIEYGPDHAVVTLVSVIDDQTVIELAADMRHLRRECFYEWAHLEIASPGGTETALNYWLAAADDLRANGLRIATRGLTSVGSAAAVMLSLGDRREARRHTRLLYHGMRVVVEGAAFTAEAAAYQADLMNRTNGDVRLRLADRALEAAADGVPACELTVEDRLVAEHLLNRVDWPGRDGSAADGGKAGDSALPRLRELVAWCAEGPRERFAALYECLMRLDQEISATLALELALIDRIVDGRGDVARERPKAPFRVPQWKALFPSGEVARDALCRHVLVLGEPGSGKTASAILPAVAAACDPANRVGCALVIDPKREIMEVASELAGDDLRVFKPGACSGGPRPIIDIMASPEWSVKADLAAGRVKTAARKVLLRSASLAPGSPAATLNGASAKAQDPYWEMEGAKFALTVVATTLAMFRKAVWRSLRKEEDAPGWKRTFPQELRDFGRMAGISKASGGKRFGQPNVLALANHVLARFFGQQDCARLAKKLADRFDEAGGETRGLAEDIRQWVDIADNTRGQYAGVHAMARQALADFGDGSAATTLYFGCEPSLEAGLASGDMVAAEFGGSVDAPDGRAVHLYQPSLAGPHDVLIARALKAAYFEAILGSAVRSRRGHGLPLVAYIADEAHRFVTSDAAHGEQSFMDACRSFGAFCVLATQSCSSLRHALGDAFGAGGHAVEMLLANTATKLFFRSTDGVAHRYVAGLCPLTPGRPNVVDVRPLSTLRPGECYAVLADGRMERRRLEAFAAPADATAG